MKLDKIFSMLAADPLMHTATYYESPKRVIRVTKQNKHTKRHRRLTYVVSIGVPNYLAVRFIKQCVKAGEPFPIKRLQLTQYPKKRNKK